MDSCGFPLSDHRPTMVTLVSMLLLSVVTLFKVKIVPMYGTRFSIIKVVCGGTARDESNSTTRDIILKCDMLFCP